MLGAADEDRLKVTQPSCCGSSRFGLGLAQNLRPDFFELDLKN